MARSTFFFYDLETSGLSPSDARIMQFAGRRTTLDFSPIGEPVNLLVRLTDDTLPSPSAILTTKITPQKTIEEGITERELAAFLQTEIFTPDTIILGFNSIRFDDKFLQHLFWRNFYDPYEWQWKNGRSRWDMLDVVRMTRALRPEGINWPITDEGKPTNRLELITKLNHISHESAHDALSDVNALIDVTRLIKETQPKLFDYLFRLRDKREIKNLVNLTTPAPFVYTSGRYGSSHNFTTVAFPLTPSKNGNILIFDLRENLQERLSAFEKERHSNPELNIKNFFFPIVKEFAYNRCPAVAPLSVLNAADGWTKIDLSLDQIQKNLASLQENRDSFLSALKPAITTDLEKFDHPPVDAESALYSSFVPDADKLRLSVIRSATADTLADFHPNFADDRLPDLLLHYKAKNFPNSLSESETKKWQAYRAARLDRQSPAFLAELKRLSEDPATSADPEKSFLLEELYLYYQSLQESNY